MDIKFTDVVGKMSEFEVLVAKSHLLFERMTNLKIDKMTDFIVKFVYSEDYHDRPVTMTILANTLMTNENSIRTKLKFLIQHELIEVIKCDDDSRTKKIKPTKLLKRLMIVDASSKLKTMEELSPLFKIAFGDKLERFYKEHNVEPYKPFTDMDAHKNYNNQYLDAKNRYKNILKKLG